jgi:phenylpyruvate tautomerase PptA (4-oxalocrotonate tautomerase family)
VHIHANGEGTTHAHLPVLQPAGTSDASAKAEIAEEVANIHCNATCAPRSFVNVLFFELPEGDCFVAGGKPATHLYIFGNIRHGRDLETRQGMLRDLSQMWIRVTGQSEAELVVSLTEIDPTNAMEAGLILPEPGSEQQWFGQNRGRLTQLGWTTA